MPPKFYVIGTYSDALHSILGSYATEAEARRAIDWQGRPRGEIKWHDRARTRAETWFSGGRYPDAKTQWTIATPGASRGQFQPLDGGSPLTVARGCYTVEAFDRILTEAHPDA